MKHILDAAAEAGLPLEQRMRLLYALKKQEFESWWGNSKTFPDFWGWVREETARLSEKPYKDLNEEG